MTDLVASNRIGIIRKHRRCGTKILEGVLTKCFPTKKNYKWRQGLSSVSSLKIKHSLLGNDSENIKKSGNIGGGKLPNFTHLRRRRRN